MTSFKNASDTPSGDSSCEVLTVEYRSSPAPQYELYAMPSSMRMPSIRPVLHVRTLYPHRPPTHTHTHIHTHTQGETTVRPADREEPKITRVFHCKAVRVGFIARPCGCSPSQPNISASVENDVDGSSSLEVMTSQLSVQARQQQNKSQQVAASREGIY